MVRDDSGAAGAVVMAFVLGAITGAAVALLVAPTSGEETRRVIADRARQGRERANDVARQGKDFVNRGKQTVNDALDRGREAYQQARGGAAGAPGATGGGESL